ncbi:MAG: RNA polymerase sigma factor [Acidimicrobiia bacterium]
MTEKRLISEAAGGDPDAFLELIKPHDQALRGLAYRMLRDSHLMDDALQDAYLAAYRGLPRFRGDSSFKTWIFRIVHNACIDIIRKRRELDEVEELPADGFDAVTDLRLDLEDALDRIPHDHRAVLLVVDVHGFDYSAAARILDVPVGTVRSRLSRARQAMRQLLEGGGS